MIRNFRKSWWVRLVAVLTLVVDLPFMIGLDQTISALRAQESSNPENVIFELRSNRQLHDLAQEQDFSALKLFEWVRKNVSYEPYFGSVKGAGPTLASRAGNDLDKAMLLGALLSESKVSWRLVVGQVTVSTDQVQSWLGTSSASQAESLLRAAGIPYTRSSAGSAALTLTNHHWLEIQSDFFPLRGAAADDVLTGSVAANRDPEEMWVAIDPTLTGYEPRTEPTVSEIIGGDSGGLYESIIEAAQSYSAEQDHTFFSGLPANTITGAALNAANAVEQYLSSQDLGLAQFLGTSRTLTLESRGGLPGNLPYDVASISERLYPENLTPYLNKNSVRRTLTVRLGPDPFLKNQTEFTISTPRLALHPLVIRFDAIDSAGAFETYKNVFNVPVTDASLQTKPVITVGGNVVTPPENNMPSVALGSKLWLEVLDGGEEIVRLPIIAGGRYQLGAVDSLNRTNLIERRADLTAKAAALANPSPVGDGNQNAPLDAYLDLAVHHIVHQTTKLDEAAAAAGGFRKAGRGALAVAGLEPAFTGGHLTTTSLVSHYVPAYNPGASYVAVTPEPLASQSQITNAAALMREVGFSHALEPLTGTSAYQSATVQMVNANTVNEILHKKTTPTDAAPSLVNEAPSLAALVPGDTRNNPVALNQLTGEILGGSSIAFTGAGLLGQWLPARTITPAGEVSHLTKSGWGFWELASARGVAVSPEGMGRSAWAPMEFLYPLDLVAGGSSERYRQLMNTAIPGTKVAAGITESLAEGLTGPVAMVLPWLEADGSANAAGIPAAAIALHGAAKWFEKPRVEDIFVLPEVLNTAGNEPENELDAYLRSSVEAESVTWRVTDPSGSTVHTVTDEPGVTAGDADDPEASRTYIHTNLLASAPLTDNRYTLHGSVTIDNGVSSVELSYPFIVDNTAPTVELIPHVETVTGSFNIKGRAADANFESWELFWKAAAEQDWSSQSFATGTSEAPLVATLAVANTRALGWTGPIDIKLKASDKAGNTATTETQLNVFNDVHSPAVDATFAVEGSDPAIEKGATLTDVVNLNFTASDLLPTVADNLGLASAKLYFASEDNSRKAPTVIFEKNWGTGELSHQLASVPVTLDTSKVSRTYLNERFKLVAEATDRAGNRAVLEKTGLTLGNALLWYKVDPQTFRPGFNSNTRQNNYCLIQAQLAEPVASWQVVIRDEASNEIASFEGSNQSSFHEKWEGRLQNGQFAPPGRYIASLTYTGASAPIEQPIKLASSEGHNPCVSSLVTNAAEDGSGEDGFTLDLSEDCSSFVDGATSFIITAKHPYVVINAAPGDAMKPFLDGENTEENSYPNSRPTDGYWALEFKSSETTPTQTEPKRADHRIMDRSNWHLIAWGDDLPEDGKIHEVWDTKNLPEGYYDVRLWVTDGFSPTVRTIYYLKISRTTDSPASGIDDDIGAMTLSATDMTVPFNGFSANVTRSYNSNDIYEPGPFGYGWRLGSIGLEIERYHNQGSGEYDEAMIRLPDGRKFFFANIPAKGSGAESGGSSPHLNAWATQGEYLQRPYGMRLFRPGGSHQYHGGTTNEYVGGPAMSPGSTENIQLYYSDENRSYPLGSVAYLQTEDKSWNIFEWATGDLLKIIKPDGQVVNFSKKSESEIEVSDTSDRKITVIRDPSSKRISSIVDPSGKAVIYEYDAAGNLSVVTDRSGRKRFYIYDTREAKQLFPERTDLTGSNPHYLVDVRVDDDLSDGPRVSPIAGDRLPETLNEQDPQSFLAYQDWPGDVSILQSKYENGKLVGIETAGGTVTMDHNEGEEVVRDERTGAESRVVYDEQRRVTDQYDFYGGHTGYLYNDVSTADGSISGVLTEEVNALGEKTLYDYVPPAQAEHKNFADMFSKYVAQQINDQTTMDIPGYLTAAQSQPTEIRQGPAGDVVTNITYGYQDQTYLGKAAQFQPVAFGAPGGSGGELDYDIGTGKLVSVSVGDSGPETINQYYGEDDSGEARWKIGRLKNTTVKATPDAHPQSTSYDYSKDDTGNETHTVTDDSTGLVTTSKYDSTGNLLSSTNARGVTVTTITDGEGRVTQASDEQGNTVYSYYNVLGQKYLERFSRVLDTPMEIVNIWTRYTYDDAGRTREVVREAEINGGEKHLLSRSRTDYEETATGRIETSYDTLGMGSRSHYDAGGRLTRSEQLDANGGVMSWSAYEYDALGRKEKETNSSGITTDTDYDTLGRVKLTTVNGPNISRSTQTRYDGAGRVKATSYETEDGSTYWTIFTYDDLGRLRFTYYDCADESSPSSVFSEITYDLIKGHKTNEIDEAGIATHYDYDDDTGVINGITLAAGTTEASLFTFVTDDFGNQTEIKNPLDRVRKKVYDTEGRLKYEFGPVADEDANPDLVGKRQATEYTYYESGQLETKSEGIAPADSDVVAEHRTTRYFYNPVTDRLIRREFGDSGEKDTYTYAADGRLERVERWSVPPEGSTAVRTHWREFTYDPRTGQAATVSSPEGVISYTYHTDGSLATINTSAGYNVAYTYDGMGNIKTVAGSSVGGTVTYTYNDKTGRKTQVERPNGVTTAYAYFPRGFLQSITETGPAGDVLTQVYTRDDRGLVETLTETYGTEQPTVWTYGYDDLKRLKTATASGHTEVEYIYGYDKAGHRLSKSVEGAPGSGAVVSSYVYNNLDQLISESTPGQTGKGYGYDIYGNLFVEMEGTVTKRTYSWNAENQMTRVVLVEGGKTYTYRYDANGTKVWREVADGPTDSIKTNYLSDYVNPSGYSQALQETTEAGEGHAYVWSGEGLLAQTGISSSGGASGGGGPPTGDTEFAHTDHLGTVKELTGAGGAAVGAALKYSPFGELTAGSDDATSYRFTGQYAEDELGLQYHRARWLSTARAGWLSQDPVWDFPANFGNGYGYVGNSPLAATDITGKVTLIGSGLVSNIIQIVTLVALTAIAVGVWFPGIDGGKLRAEVGNAVWYFGKKKEALKKGVPQSRIDKMLDYNRESKLYDQQELRLVLESYQKYYAGWTEPTCWHAANKAFNGMLANFPDGLSSIEFVKLQGVTGVDKFGNPDSDVRQDPWNLVWLRPKKATTSDPNHNELESSIALYPGSAPAGITVMTLSELRAGEIASPPALQFIKNLWIFDYGK